MKGFSRDRFFISAASESKDEGLAELGNFIFGARDPSESYSQLTATGKVFLIRESRFDGMLTVDYQNREKDRYTSMRFAFLPEEGGWTEVPYHQVQSAQRRMRKVKLDSSDLGEYVQQLLEVIQKKLSLDLRDLLKPSPWEQTRNNLYSAYSVFCDAPSEENKQRVSNLLQETVCPITLKEADQLDEAVILFNQVYEREAIVAWVTEKGECPRSRRSATLEDIKPTEGVRRLINRLSM